MDEMWQDFERAENGQQEKHEQDMEKDRNLEEKVREVAEELGLTFEQAMGALMAASSR